MATTTRKYLPIYVRWMIRSDLEQVLAIERQSFEFPWNSDNFIRCLRQANCRGMIADYDTRTVGFMIYQELKKSIHLITLAVDPKYRRQNAGSIMVTKVVNQLCHRTKQRVLVRVRERNLPTQLLLKKEKFLLLETQANQYEQTDEDMYIFQYKLESCHEDGEEHPVVSPGDELPTHPR